MTDAISGFRPTFTPPPSAPPADVGAPEAPEAAPKTNAAPAAGQPSTAADAIVDAARIPEEPLPFPAADAPRSASIEGLSQAYETFVAANPELRPQADALIAQINDPMQIKQEGYDTCAATVVQRAMAGSEPLKYFNAVTQLMTGNNATKQEPVLKINSANLAFSMREGNGTKGATDPNKNVNQVIQAALMDFGNGGDNYDLAQGVSRGEGTIESEGLTETEVKDLFEAVLGRPPLLSSDLASTGGNPDALKALVIDQLTKNGDLYVPLDFGREVVTKSNDTYNTYKNYKSSYDLENDREPTYETIENNMSHMVKIEGLPYDMVPKDPSGKPFMVGNPKKEYSYKVINVINPTTGKGESMPFDSVLEAIGRANGKASGGPFGIKPPPRKPGG